ncbi:hypothetical protein [Aquimarina hainanensis]|uniref:hypothetical protein n=1 Tax=Aquimarina hainanensis TaxID=1578017 RepID=UPI0036157214
MKSRPVLISAIILTIIVEIILMILVYNKIGGERLPTQIGRLNSPDNINIMGFE